MDDRPLSWMETPDPDWLALDRAVRAERLLREASAIAVGMRRRGERFEACAALLLAAGLEAKGALGR